MMSTSRLNYLKNLLTRKDASFPHPLVVTYYVTTKCNLNCRYCEDFGARLNSNSTSSDYDQAREILTLIRGATDEVVFTGGEPLIHPRIADLIRFAKQGLKFKQLTILTNGYLLDRHESILSNIDRLIVSLDSTDPQKWHSIIGAPVAIAEKIIENIQVYAHKQKSYGYRLILNAVITPDTIHENDALLAFAEKHNTMIAFSPQSIHNWPNYDLIVSEEYRKLLRKLLQAKKTGAPILGSEAYFNTLIDFTPYQCSPLLAPRVMPNGDLIYPCRPMEKDGHGGRINLLDIHDWGQAIARVAKDYGDPPQACTSCFQQCYAEPSLMQSKPLKYLEEFLKYKPTRQAALATFSPG